MCPGLKKICARMPAQWWSGSNRDCRLPIADITGEQKRRQTNPIVVLPVSNFFSALQVDTPGKRQLLDSDGVSCARRGMEGCAAVKCNKIWVCAKIEQGF
jgi:hypothetical protein